MSDSHQVSREFMLEFINLYRNSTCLWKTKSKEYMDRNQKELAYAELVKKCQEVDPKATKFTVVKKINSFKRVYKRELKKINKSLKSEVEVYKPNLWYFEHLHFLTDVEPKISKNTIVETEEGIVDEAVAVVKEEMTLTRKQSDQPYGPTPQNETTVPEDNSDQSATMRLPHTLVRDPFQRPTKRKINPFEQASLETILQVGEKMNLCKEDDFFDRFGKYVSDRLRESKPNQQKIVQKLISDVLFEADMESLNRFWKVSGPDVEPYQYSGFTQFMSYRQDNSYQNNYNCNVAPRQDNSYQNNYNCNVAPRPNPFNLTQANFPGQSSYTNDSTSRLELTTELGQSSYASENNVIEYVLSSNSFNDTLQQREGGQLVYTLL